MKAAFKFIKHKNGITAFAEVGVECVPSSDFSIRWANGLAQYERHYGGAVRDGITRALRWHIDQGGGSAEFTISEFVELLVDTREDAVQCASAAAAWKALGHSEAELTFSFDGTWHVTKST